jgi:hypothetical protein
MAGPTEGWISEFLWVVTMPMKLMLMLALLRPARQAVNESDLDDVIGNLHLLRQDLARGQPVRCTLEGGDELGVVSTMEFPSAPA